MGDREQPQETQHQQGTVQMEMGQCSSGGQASGSVLRMGDREQPQETQHQQGTVQMEMGQCSSGGQASGSVSGAEYL
ncbi:hypothetical protein KSP40_PGU001601 [Platanthera guangdongensis]|uniref:Uncharacterized protein n=1 Tax=Platanthera guangdongensis TaxID=2320717 RepID=A0ABR2MW37_9ASPA